MENEIAVLDFGSQYTHLIARRIRQLGVKSHIYSSDIHPEELKNAIGIILSGGPRSIIDDSKLDYYPQILYLDKPILGLCYGHQLIAEHFAGKVVRGNSKEYGKANLQVVQSPIFDNINPKTIVWMSHGDHVATLPQGFQEIGKTGNNSISAMANEDARIYGLQFHPEVHHTKEGMKMLFSFVFNICKAKENWDSSKMYEQLLEDIKRNAKNKKVFLLVSGGVDSTVCFALLEKTLGKDRVFGLHIDSGFMRMDESKNVISSLSKIGFDNLHTINAENRYLDALKNIADPEKKREIIGNLFVDLTEEIMNDLDFNESEWLLGQGTIYPDTIESGSTKNADKIKTHHNRVDKIQKMIEKNLIIEPISELYKDEVRMIGRKLGIPSELIDRHPFPGPGLAIRCLCSDEDNDNIISRTCENKKIYILPVRSVGVQGDERTYAYPAVIDTEFPDWTKLKNMSPKITNKNSDINRVLICLSGNIEYLKKSQTKKAYLTKDRIELLRKIDHIVNKSISSNIVCKNIWQFPVVLVPFGYNKFESIVLRPVESKEAMTVSFAELPMDIIKKISSEIKRLDAIDFIFYDITNKPPGTIEWE